MAEDCYAELRHKVKNVVTVVNEAIEVVLDETAGKINENQKKFLTTARQAARKLIELADQFKEKE